MSLSLKQLQDVCLIGSGDYRRCRYLAQDDTDSDKWYCLKCSSKKVEIDDEIAEIVLKADPRKQGMPIGDNCRGYPLLKHIEQGYDK